LIDHGPIEANPFIIESEVACALRIDGDRIDQ
jgi:hypothetical protein